MATPPRYAICDPVTGIVVQTGSAQVADVPAFLADNRAVLITEANYNVLKSGTWRLVNGALIAVPPPVPKLADTKATAVDMIDRAAENARQAWLSRGAGQAMEYIMTDREARAASAAPDPLDPAKYPFLVAEQHALAAAGQVVSLRVVASNVLALCDAWVAVGAQIKQVRRTAKLKVDAAADAAAIKVILDQIFWPKP